MQRTCCSLLGGRILLCLIVGTTYFWCKDKGGCGTALIFENQNKRENLIKKLKSTEL